MGCRALRTLASAVAGCLLAIATIAPGRSIVRDLGIDVPFTWQGRDGDSQMVAGGPDHPIWFTNLIYHNTLYTLTYSPLPGNVVLPDRCPPPTP
ncbi:MAG: hypothetical protein ACRDP8_26075 [Actinopolymorphaceae bacterium]